MTELTRRSQISVPSEKIGEICQQYQIRWFALFGSVLRDDFRPDSDIDILVEFEPGHTPGFAFIDIQDKLSELLGEPLTSIRPKISVATSAIVF